MMASTPMYEQYKSLRKRYPGTILLFRLGDFYEAFENDAKTLSKVLGITLTGRGKGDNRIPMAGIPHHALHQYIPKLIKADYKIAIADQLEKATTGKLVKRDVVKIITPGTITDENMLNASENNYIASIALYEKTRWSLSYSDISTGEFNTAEYIGVQNEIPRPLMQELFKIRPSEILVNRKNSEIFQQLKSFSLNKLENSDFELKKNYRTIMDFFNLKNLKAFDLERNSASIITAGVLIEYLINTQKTSLKHITKIFKISNKGELFLDENSIRSLEIFYSIRGDYKNTLYNCLNECKTPMGQRLLRKWLVRPLADVNKLNVRYQLVEELIKNKRLIEKLGSELDTIIDMQRMLSRVVTGSINGRDLLFLSKSVVSTLNIFKCIEESSVMHLKTLLPAQTLIEQSVKIYRLVEKSINDDPPITITDGGIIKKGFNTDLDKLLTESEKGKLFIQNLQDSEREKTNITNLKVGFNSVFGYYIEVSKSHISKVPDNYIRKQTLVNGERYITKELKKWETIVLNAQTQSSEMEYQIFQEIRSEILEYIQTLVDINEIVAQIDVYVNFATISTKNNFVRPEISDNIEESTEIKSSRHIVVERMLGEKFIPNDVAFIGGKQELIILTGPNMSGKSTYIRQIALLFIIAQIGCFVPAEYAKLVIVDKIFTRIGSADNLAGGESTFMVEMSEAANILNNATPNSLIILDEIGRGTSTYDGLALAWSIVEHIVTNIKARTLFATHYHELVKLEDQYTSVKNYNVKVLEKDGKVIFMHKIVQGATDRSYGIYVANISGIPSSILSRAGELLDKFENLEEANTAKPIVNYVEQLSFSNFDDEKEIKQEIKNIDLDNITPLDALLKIKELKEKITKDKT